MSHNMTEAPDELGRRIAKLVEKLLGGLWFEPCIQLHVLPVCLLPLCFSVQYLYCHQIVLTPCLACTSVFKRWK